MRSEHNPNGVGDLLPNMLSIFWVRDIIFKLIALSNAFKIEFLNILNEVNNIKMIHDFEKYGILTI